MPIFETQVSLACSPEVLFDFLIRPKNVVTLNPPEMSFLLLDAPEVVAEGSRVRFQIEAYGFKQQLLHEIINFQRPTGFLLRELEGVLKKFEHEHNLIAQPDGSTLLFERVVYEPPGGLVGFLLTENRLRETMEKNFHHRHRQLKRQIDPA
jgi:ligand-binding SRPBCC domain-containing protein